LVSGEEATISATWTAPQTPEAKDIYVVVDPALSSEDKDRSKALRKYKLDIQCNDIGFIM